MAVIKMNFLSETIGMQANVSVCLPSMSFEDMMAKFKSQSEEKISDLKRVTEARRGGGYSRRR